VSLLQTLPKPDREEGDPFANGLSDYQRAARLIGRKIVVRKLFAGKYHEAMYRVDYFRRFIPKRGLGLGLVEFYGPRAVRSYRIEDRPEPWKTEGDETFCHIVSVLDPNETFTIK
jgi:hypothetical protein